ncbi:hypothetical protein [Dactylosporangium matsuzakiense]|uniref:Lipoprotein n=1 Tax=Dactylosporangium matsuzakiense TaxID=53360 RepID=A0A9W6KVD4_9ACTN|nr:hypothetical protein [Dactylosporangium matsuzakiense]UWZ47845.1 hypothetical protein Dmats_16435 [Dactylosporangium matsuzakiense]GLL08777.1 hypothetical protein GCM10017581_105500 [Dactylosporangium matsuzakiense]
MRALSVLTVALVLAAAIAGCSTDGYDGTELTSSATGEDYHAPVWVGDTLYYLQEPVDSDSSPYPMRIRPGGQPEPVGFTGKPCRSGRTQWPFDLLPLGEHTVGVLSSCADERPTLTRIDEGGPQEDAAREPGAGFTVEPCGMRPVDVPEAGCVGGPGVRHPVTAPGGDTYYFAPRCGEDAAKAGTYSVCRLDGSGGATTVGTGVGHTMGLDARANRVVVAGTVNGEEAGLWLLDGGRFTRLATGDFADAGISADGSRVVSVLTRKRGWWSETTYSLRVVAIPDR